VLDLGAGKRQWWTEAEVAYIRMGKTLDEQWKRQQDIAQGKVDLTKEEEEWHAEIVLDAKDITAEMLKQAEKGIPILQGLRATEAAYKKILDHLKKINEEQAKLNRLANQTIDESGPGIFGRKEGIFGGVARQETADEMLNRQWKALPGVGKFEMPKIIDNKALEKQVRDASRAMIFDFGKVPKALETGFAGAFGKLKEMSAAAGKYQGFADMAHFGIGLVPGLKGSRGGKALGGAASGAVTGAAMGSVIPGLGTAVGALIGGGVGALGGLVGGRSGRYEASNYDFQGMTIEELIDQSRFRYSDAGGSKGKRRRAYGADVASELGRRGYEYEGEGPGGQWREAPEGATGRATGSQAFASVATVTEAQANQMVGLLGTMNTQDQQRNQILTEILTSNKNIEFSVAISAGASMMRFQG